MWATTVRSILRLLCAAILAVGLVIYLVAVVTGKVPAAQKVTIADLAALVIGLVLVSLLVRPRLIGLVEVLQIGQVKLQLRQLEDSQQSQKRELDDIRFTLSMLVSAEGRKHLQNLQAGTTSNYERSYWLESELRHLRLIGLIRSKRAIGEMPSYPFDLSDFIDLTDLGRDYLRRADLVLTPG
jgi:hypothetical protein